LGVLQHHATGQVLLWAHNQQAWPGARRRSLDAVRGVQAAADAHHSRCPRSSLTRC
jgi:hypothetical protein